MCGGTRRGFGGAADTLSRSFTLGCGPDGPRTPGRVGQLKLLKNVVAQVQRLRERLDPACPLCEAGNREGARDAPGASTSLSHPTTRSGALGGLTLQVRASRSTPVVSPRMILVRLRTPCSGTAMWRGSISPVATSGSIGL